MGLKLGLILGLFLGLFLRPFFKDCLGLGDFGEKGLKNRSIFEAFLQDFL